MTHNTFAMPENKEGRDFIVGDIHGCFADLDRYLSEVSFSPEKDRLFSTGDLIDRGPESRRALEFLNMPWFFPVLGNHEKMFLDCWIYETHPIEFHFRNGGSWVAAENDYDLLVSLANKIMVLPLAIQVGNIGIVHSVVPKGIAWGSLMNNPDKYAEEVLWDRIDKDLKYNIDGIALVYAGHSINRVPTQIYENLIDIDTGAFLKYWEGESGRLTFRRLG